MGDYDDIIIGDDTIKVKGVDNAQVLENHSELLPRGSVIGLDIKRLFSYTHTPSYDIIVLCWKNPSSDDDKPEPYRCLIVHLGYMNNEVPNKLKALLTDTDICFVTPTLIKSYNWIHCVEAGYLAARFLKKPGLCDTSLWNVASKVGVSHDRLNGCVSSENGVKGEIDVSLSNMMDLTPAQVKKAVSEAFTCYRVGAKLLLDPKN